MNILSIDVGLYHFGYTYIRANDDYTLNKIIDCDLVDITSACKDKFCVLYHDACISDYMSHFFKNYNEMLLESNIILVEQQPPLGFIAIQELIRYKYREKTIMVSPSSVHAHFNIGFLDYNQRKIQTEKYAMGYMSDIKNFVFQNRRHDIADSFCQLMFYLEVQNKLHVKKVYKEAVLNDFKTLVYDMNNLKFDESYL